MQGDKTMAAESGRVTSPAVALAMVFLAYTLNLQDRVVFSVLQQPIKQEFHLTDSELGLLGGTSFGIIYALMMLPLARLAERYNRVRIIAATMIVFSLFTSATALATSFILLMICRAGVAAGEGGTLPAGQSLLADLFAPERRITAFAVVSAGGPVGSLLGSILGGIIGDQWGWRTAFLVLGVPGAILALILLALVREPQRGRLDPPIAAGTPIPSLKEVVAALVKSPILVHTLAGMTVGIFVSFAVTMFAPTFAVRKYGVSLSTAGLIIGGGVGVAGTIGGLVWGYLADRTGQRDPRWKLWIAAVCLPICTIFLLFAYSSADLLTFSILIVAGGFFQSCFIAQCYGVATALVGPQMRTTVMAIFSLVTNSIGLGLGPLALGTMSDHFASRFFGNGYAACPGSLAKGGGLDLACQAASSQGVEYAILACLLLFFWAAAHFAIAGRLLKASR